jgi:hypothetical protein
MRLAALFLLISTGCAVATDDPVITSATYSDPTTRYAHGVLGDDVEWGALEMRLSDGGTARVELPVERVFEDLSPRIADLDGDGAPEIVAVESHARFGARLSVYGASGLIATNDWIGRPNRWLAPAGIGDIDGDGFVEIGYVDRPHLAKELKIYRFRDGALEFVDSIAGVTNHRIGWDYILGGLRDCGAGPEFILASANWRDLVAVSWRDGALRKDIIGQHTDREAFAAALTCG